MDLPMRLLATMVHYSRLWSNRTSAQLRESCAPCRRLRVRYLGPNHRSHHQRKAIKRFKMTRAATSPPSSRTPPRVMLSLSRLLTARPPSSCRAEFSRARSNIIFLLFSGAVTSPAPNRVPAEAQRGERQPHRRAAGRPRRVTPLRGGRPLEHHHVPARARGVSTPRGEESKQQAGWHPPNGGLAKSEDVVFREIINFFNITYNSGQMAS